jgi:hypothetical protein
MNTRQFAELHRILRCVRDGGGCPDLPQWFQMEFCGGFAQVYYMMKEDHGMQIPMPNARQYDTSYDAYFQFVNEAQKDGFIYILTAPPQNICKRQMYHVTLPIDRQLLLDVTKSSECPPEVCDIILKYVNWPGIPQILPWQVSLCCVDLG